MKSQTHKMLADPDALPVYWIDDARGGRRKRRCMRFPQHSTVQLLHCREDEDIHGDGDATVFRLSDGRPAYRSSLNRGLWMEDEDLPRLRERRNRTYRRA